MSTHHPDEGGALPACGRCVASSSPGCCSRCSRGSPRATSPSRSCWWWWSRRHRAVGVPPGAPLVSITMSVVVVWWAFSCTPRCRSRVLVGAAGAHRGARRRDAARVRPASLALDPQLALLWTGRGRPDLDRRASPCGRWRAPTHGHGSPALFWLTGLAAALVGAVVAGVRGADPGQGVPAGEPRPRAVRRAGAQLRRADPARPGVDVRRDRGGGRPGRRRGRAAAGRVGDGAARRCRAVVARRPCGRLAAAEPRGRRAAVLPRRGHAPAADREGVDIKQAFWRPPALG